MKNIKKILFPILTIASTASLVTPLLTSCGSQNGMGIEEVKRNYIPTIEKHQALPFADPDEMATDYLKGIKKNPYILSEDNKYTTGQLYEALASFFENWILNSNASFKPEFTVNSIKGGASEVSVNDKDQYTYKNGFSVSLTAKIDLDMDAILSEWFQTTITGYGDYKIAINTKNLGYNIKFTNFEKFNVTKAYTLLDGSYTLVQPVFPADLTTENWAVDVDVFGDLSLTINDVEVISLEKIGTDFHFDHDNILLLAIPLFSNTYIIDVLQELGSFASYYMSDVNCQNRLGETKNHIVDLTFNRSTSSGTPSTWKGTINYLKPIELDMSKCIAGNAGTGISIGSNGFTESLAGIECSTDISLIASGTTSSRIATPIIGNEIDYTIAKAIEIDETETNPNVYEWRERHYVYPRFNHKMYHSYNGQWFWTYMHQNNNIYTYGTLCKFEFDVSSSNIIKNGKSFNISIYEGNYPTGKYITLGDVVIKFTDTDDKETTLVEKTDYEINDDYTAITFKKDFNTSGKMVIELTTQSTLNTTKDEVGYPNIIDLS